MFHLLVVWIVWFIKQFLWYKPFKPTFVSQIKNLLQCLYGCFSHSPKKHLKFTKLVEIMKTKGNKILHVIKLNDIYD
jgi:hypothetical protein